MTKEKFEFQSEVKQLLNILVYSLYKHKEVFLRELISNAVDALNKVQFQILTGKTVAEPDLDLKIDISFIKSKNTLVIEDTGIGMTKKELVDNIGTIAHSGTVDFLKKVSESKETNKMDLIGQFGVGFYSSFMVAEQIHIYTRSFSKGSKGLLWKSKGDNSYSIEETTKKVRGTRIELILKKEEKDFLETFRIKNIIAEHSKFVPFPIYLENEKIESTQAIWSQPKSSLKAKDYTDFYKFFENSQEDPETYIHLSSDAPVQFNSILFIPKTSFEFLGFGKSDPGVDLYSKKVLIQKACKDIMPEYLRFVKGVIDSEEIPLNISRETIQNDLKIGKIKKHVIKKILSHLESIKKKDREKYLKMWANFNRNLKEGIINDFSSREKIAPLLLFHSSKTPAAEYTDFQTYVDSMAKDQNEIYYISGTDVLSLEKNPALEAFKKKDIEVLYMIDPIDEFVVDHLREFASKKFKMAESADIKLDKSGDSEKNKDYLKNVDSFTTYLKTVYGDQVADVKVSKRLVDSPCILSQAADGPSVQMERIMKMANKDYKYSKKVFEINPEHDLIKGMISIHKQKPDSEKLKTLVMQLMENMLLREGVLDNIDHIVPRIQEIMLMAVKEN